MLNSMSRTIGSSAAAFGAAAILVSSAVAGVRPDDRSGPLGVGGTSEEQIAPVRPDDRGAPIGVGALAAPVSVAATGIVAFKTIPVRPDDRHAARGPGVFFTAPTHVAAPDVFQLDDAALGAVATFGAVLLAAAAAFTLRRRSRPVAN